MPVLYVAFILSLLQVNTVSASEEAWVVDRDRAAYSTFRYEASEGTWISLDVSPDGRTIIFDLLGQLYRVPIVGGDATALTQGRSWNQFPRFSPDGRKLAFTSDRTGSEDLWVMDLSDGTLKNVSQMELPVFQGTWTTDSPLGRRFLPQGNGCRVDQASPGRSPAADGGARPDDGTRSSLGDGALRPRRIHSFGSDSDRHHQRFQASRSRPFARFHRTRQTRGSSDTRRESAGGYPQHPIDPLRDSKRSGL